MMNIVTIGAGFVGATHSAVLASFGHKALAYDLNKERIADLSSRVPERIDACIYEPGLANLIKTHDNLQFTSELADIYALADQLDVIFLCLPTPAHELILPEEQRHLFIAAKTLAEILKKRNNGEQTKHIIIVNKSTVPIGTAEKLKTKFAEWGVRNFGIASNPEFLVEGKAVQGSKNPDRIVIGVENAGDEKILREIYSTFSESKVIAVKPSDAEAIKLLANFELFSTIVRTYQVIGRLCELVPGLQFENVVRGITADARIPKWGHFTSLYAGGSCFEKDAKNLLHTVSQYSGFTPTTEFIKLVIAGNDQQLEHFYNRAKNEAHFSFAGKTVAMLGTAFKQDTNDVRLSPALVLADWLCRDGVKTIRVYDPQAGENFRKSFAGKPQEKHIIICSSAEEALNGTDAAIIATDWPEFKMIAPIFTMKPPYLLMDGRRSLAPHYADIHARGISVLPVGSPYLGTPFRS